MKKLPKKFKLVLIAFLLIGIIISFAGCGNEDEESKSINKAENDTGVNEASVENGENPIATMDVEYINSEGETKTGIVKIELYVNEAPTTVANFICLAQNGFYDGLTFHRIVSNFVIQGGDPNGDGSGSAKISDLDKSIDEGSSEDYAYSIKGEFSDNGVDNNLKFGPGVVGLARSDFSYYGMTEEGYNSGCSQFFIMNTDDESTAAYLDGAYAAFGKVIEGYDIILDMSNVKLREDEDSSETSSTPVNAPIIKKIEVETYGKTYDMPETINYDEVTEKIQSYLIQLYSSYYNSNSTETTN